ncbi:MAG TPA: hypothetical protein VLF63_02220, partial [Patescibacteria group bacterium]|nr:hypothetical protein [Patescibacteria group bacterium]
VYILSSTHAFSPIVTLGNPYYISSQATISSVKYPTPLTASQPGIPIPQSTFDACLPTSPTTGPQTPTCYQDMLNAINSARNQIPQDQLIPKMNINLSALINLPQNQQMFIITNAERVDRGLPPITSMTSQLNSYAVYGAKHDCDPGLNSSGCNFACTFGTDCYLTGGAKITSVGSNLAAGDPFNILIADYYWMYADGLNDGNSECTSTVHKGCWGHRSNILGDYDQGSGCGQYMGNGFVANSTYPENYGQIFVGACGPSPTDQTYQWSTALKLGLYSPAGVSPPAQPLGCSTDIGSTLSAGQTLTQGQCLVSSNRYYAMEFTPLAVKRSALIIFETVTNDYIWNKSCSGKYLTLQTDGNLVAYSLSSSGVRQVCWSSGSHGLGGSYATLEDSSDLVIRRANGTAIWDTKHGFLVDPPGVLNNGEYLYPGEELFSPSLAYRLVLQKGGNLVEYDSTGTAIWASGTNGQSIAYLTVQGDGNIVLRDIYGVAQWTPTTQGLGGNRLQLNDDGHMVVYADSYLIVWYNSFGNTSGAGVLSRFTGTMNINGVLTTEHQLVSPTRQYRLILQTDGNLVIYNRNNVAIWSTGTHDTLPTAFTLWGVNSDLILYDSNGTWLWTAGISGMGGTVMYLGDDGNISVNTGNGYTVWSLYTGQYYFPNHLSMGQYLYPGQQMLSPGHNARLVLQTAGNLVAYNRSNTAIWATNTGGQCPAYFTLQSDSNVVLRRCDGVADWTPSTQGTGAVNLYLGEDGNIWLNTSLPQTVWSLYTGFYYLPNVLWAGQYLYPGYQIWSAGHHFRLIEQTDGNLVIYNQYNNAVWASGSWGIPPGFLVMQGDGNLLQRDVWGNTLHYGGLPSNTQNLSCNSAYIGDDGDINIYTTSGYLRWTLHRGRLF